MTRKSLRHLSFLLFLLFLFLTTAAQSAEIVRAELTKEKAWTGEAIQLVITLFSPGPFSGTAAFELPELPRTAIIKTGNPVVGSEVIEGDTWFTQRHDFRLYTQRTGTITIPAFVVRFKGKKTFTSDPEPMEGLTPKLQFESNRPPGTENLGVVVATTQMRVEQAWTPNESAAVQAGDVVQRTITRRAMGTTAMMLGPAPSNAPAGVRVYTPEATVEDKTDRGQSNAVRSDTLKYQFERPGTFELPELTFRWWDTAAGELKRDSLPGRTISVEGVADVLEETETAKAQDTESVWRWVALILGIGVLTWACYQPLMSLISSHHAKRNTPEAIASRRVEAACRSNDAPAAYCALLDWRRSTSLMTSGISGDQLEAAGETDLLLEWQALSTHVFGANSGETKWSGQGLQTAFSKLRGALKGKQRSTRSIPELPALNPESVRS